jgi:chaperonin GroES
MLKPLGDRVVVKPGEGEETTPGGIVLPDSARKRPTEGEVIAVGTGRVLRNGERVPVSVAVGDTIVYSKYAGTEVTVDAEDLVIVDEDSILAVRD